MPRAFAMQKKVVDDYSFRLSKESAHRRQVETYRLGSQSVSA